MNQVIYFSQSELLLAKTNEHRTKSRKALLILFINIRIARCTREHIVILYIAVNVLSHTDPKKSFIHVM